MARQYRAPGARHVGAGSRSRQARRRFLLRHAHQGDLQRIPRGASRKDRRPPSLCIDLHAPGPAAGEALLRPVVRLAAAAGALYRHAHWAQSHPDRLRRLSRGGWRQGAVPLDAGAGQRALHDSDPGSQAERAHRRCQVRQAVKWGRPGGLQVCAGPPGPALASWARTGRRGCRPQDWSPAPRITMTKLSILIAIGTTLAAAPAQTSGPWTIAEGHARGTLTISHTTLGILLGDVRLNLREGNRLHRLDHWAPAPGSPNTFVVRTAQPRTAWQFELGPETLKISSTVANAVITAVAPASANRVVARLLDPQGTPVYWVGTSEVADGYGGAEPHNPSFLPRRNPECMYFALGRVSSPIFHSLFDRQTDTAIQFTDRTVLRRNAEDADLFDVTMP